MRLRRTQGWLWALALVLLPTRAASLDGANSTEVVWFPGASRAISHALSASRDTALLAGQLYPFPAFAAGADAAVLGIGDDDWGARVGVFGMLEVHSACRWLTCETGLWRGLAGGSVALASQSPARRRLPHRPVVEATLSLRHESEHSSTTTDAPFQLADGVSMGNLFMPDLALRVPAGDVDIELRAQYKVFFAATDRSYKLGPGSDAIVRWRLHDRFHPFGATFFEYVVGDDVEYARLGTVPLSVDVPDLYTVRTHLGAILPLSYGQLPRRNFAELQVYTFVEVGHGEGVRKLQEEARWGLGLRGDVFP